MKNQITFTPIGKAHNKIIKRCDMPLEGVNSKITIYKKYARALEEIENEQYLWVLCYLHKANRQLLLAAPRKAKPDSTMLKGVFAMRSPDRPNPIALTKVKLIKLIDLTLHVEGLDVIDNTPILDIKSCKTHE